MTRLASLALFTRHTVTVPGVWGVTTWYQSLDPAGSVADGDVGPVRGGDCDSQNPVIRKGKDRVSCAIPHRLGKVKCDDSKTV